MLIVIVDKKCEEREASGRALVAQKHEVEYAHDPTSALSLIERRSPDVVLVASTLAGASGADLVKRIRIQDVAPRAYVVMTSALPASGDIRAAFAAGADDFMKKPFSHEELFARVDGANRLRARGPSAPSPVQLEVSGLVDGGAADVAICRDVAVMFGLELQPQLGGAMARAVFASRLSLSVASAGVEVVIGVGADEPSSRALAAALLGGVAASSAEMNDLMRELANLAGGAFKQVAVGVGLQFTMGLAVDVAPSSLPSVARTPRRAWVAAAGDGSLRVEFEIEVRARENKRVPVVALREGMVLARDLLNDAGALLIPEGTRLTESHLVHLPKVLGTTRLILVADAA